MKINLYSSNLTETGENFHEKWLIPTEEVRPGSSAIIGRNYLAFFAIHHLALCTISVSLVASVIVIKEIFTKWRKATSRLDFPIRFPLYLAVADTLWGISHFVDHMYLVTTQRFPEHSGVKETLSMNLWFFFGYQQLMHASVATYTFMRVVHGRKLHLGVWEWKLHTAWVCFLGGTIVIFHFMGSFGSTGYWMAHDVTSIEGLILGIVIGFTSTLNAVCTTLGYHMIRRTVQGLNENQAAYKSQPITITVSIAKQDSLKPSSTSVPSPETIQQQSQTQNQGNSYHSTASQCLTTYVRLASWIYCPLAILLWINVLTALSAQVVEPVSSLLIVLVANSSGWANAYGFFVNERIKKDREIQKLMGASGGTCSQLNSITESGT